MYDRPDDVMDQGAEEGVVVDAIDLVGDGVVEGQLLGFQAQVGGTLVLGSEALLDLDHRADDVGGVDQAIVVFQQGLAAQRLFLRSSSSGRPPDAYLYRLTCLIRLAPTTSPRRTGTAFPIRRPSMLNGFAHQEPGARAA